MFARKIGLGGSVVSEIIEASIRRGMFDREIYDKYRILTSRGIQRRYFEAVSRRKSLKVDFNILLINVAQICPNANIQTENVCISIGNVNISEQSKVEKSRVKKSILSCPSAAPTDDGAEADSFARFWALYPRHDKRRDAEKAWNTLKAWKDPDLLAAILSAVERAKSSRQWQEEGGRYIPLPASWLRGARWEDKGVVTGATAPSETEAAVRDLLT